MLCDMKWLLVSYTCTCRIESDSAFNYEIADLYNESALIMKVLPFNCACFLLIVLLAVECPLALESCEEVGGAEIPNLSSSSSQSPKREVPARIPRPDYAESGDDLYSCSYVCSTG